MLGALKQKYGPVLCSVVPLNIWHRLLGVELILPYWHVVSDEDFPHISGLYKYRNIRQFNADLEFFLRYYTPVSLQEVIQHLEGTSTLPKRCFLPTFDDGFREVYDVIAPTLLKLGVPAVFFLMTSAIDNHKLCYPQKKSLLIHGLESLNDSSKKEKISSCLTEAKIKGLGLISRIRCIHYLQRGVLDKLESIMEYDFSSYARSVQPYLTSEQIIDLIKKGFSIGAHSVDHPLYSELSLKEQLNQVQESLSFLFQHYQYECQAFAFPYTDNGISPAFFQKAFSNENLKVSFGTGGVSRHFFPKNLARFTMERTDCPAAQILARQFGKAYLGQLLKR